VSLSQNEQKNKKLMEIFDKYEEVALHYLTDTTNNDIK
jgi:hypothetical protein